MAFTKILDVNEVRPLWRWVWLYGEPNPFWFQHLGLIRPFVKEEGLKPVPVEELTQVLPNPAIAELGGDPELQATKVPRPIPFPGGLRCPHLHYKQGIYELEPAQWERFSKVVLEDFRTRLDRVGTVRFEELIDLSESLGGVTPGK